MPEQTTSTSNVLIANLNAAIANYGHTNGYTEEQIATVTAKGDSILQTWIDTGLGEKYESSMVDTLDGAFADYCPEGPGSTGEANNEALTFGSTDDAVGNDQLLALLTAMSAADLFGDDDEDDEE